MSILIYRFSLLGEEIAGYINLILTSFYYAAVSVLCLSEYI